MFSTVHLSRGRVAMLGGLLVALCSVLILAPAAGAASYTTGDVFVSDGNGQVQEFTPSGTLVQTLDTTQGGDTTGSAFDQAGNFYVTDFSANMVSQFDSTGSLVGTFGSGYPGSPESILFDQAGDAFVGQPGTPSIEEFDPSGNPVTTFSVATGDGGTGGTDWIDLAADGCTMHYTDEGTSVKTFNICTNTQGPDFATGLPGPTAYAHRILPGGGELVADGTEVVRLDSSGSVAQTYTFTGESNLFALNLDPDGTSFWTADSNTGDVLHVDIASGNVLGQFNPGTGSNTVFGLSVKGEITAATDPPISASGTAVSATEGQSFSGTVATFTDPDTSATASEYSATIDWGDGSTSAGTISGGAGNFTVAGTHTYAEEGSQTITVTITDVDNSANSATATSTATIADAAVTATGTTISAVEGASTTQAVASFSDANTGATASDYSATIDWGDGSTSAGTISGGAGNFTVTGTHTYAEEGTSSITVTITDAGGATSTASSTAEVADAALTATGTTISAVEGASTTQAVASFTDADPAATVSDYTATIDWGDGSTSAGTISASASGFTVTGSHGYAEEGTYSITVTITDAGGATSTASSTAEVADAALHSTGVSNTTPLKFDGVIASFTDADPAGSVSDYIATIDWGDGSTSRGSISNGFKVTGSHTYANADEHHVSVTITDKGGSATTAKSTLTGPPPPAVGKKVDVAPASGKIAVKRTSTTRFAALTAGEQIPVGSIIDATKGVVELTAARDRNGHTSVGRFYGGVFMVTQQQVMGRELTVLTLVGPAFPPCTSGARDVGAVEARGRPQRHLWGNSSGGGFRTQGSSASATERGTVWLTQDSCAGTLIRVARGAVTVNDFPHHRTFILRAPRSFLAHPGAGG